MEGEEGEGNGRGKKGRGGLGLISHICWGEGGLDATATNQRRPSLPMTYGNSTRRSTHTDINPGNFHL